MQVRLNASGAAVTGTIAKTARKIAAFAAALALLCGCTHGPRTLAGHTTLVIGVLDGPDSLNPLLSQGAAIAAIDPLLFSFLLTIDGAGKLTPDVAQDVPSRRNGGIASDGKTITYHLRRGVLWSDGVSLTAADVVFTYHLIMNPAVNVSSRSAYNVIASVSAPDARTVVVRLKHAYSPTLRNFFAPDQNFPILPEHVLRHETNINHGAFNSDPIGSGPYRLVSWRRSDSLHFASNPRYFRGRPKIENVVMKIVPSVSTMFTQLRTGEVDALFVNNAMLVQNYTPVPNVVVGRYAGGGVALLFLNASDPILRDVRVRKAIALGVNYSRIVHDATRGTQTSADAGRGLYGWTYDPAIAMPSYNPLRAAQLLEAAGWKRGAGGTRRRDGMPLTLTYAYANEPTQGSDIGLFLAQDLRKLGVEVTLRAYPVQVFIAPASNGGPLLSGHFQLAFSEVITPSDPALDWFFGCDQFPPNGFNLARLCDPKLSAADDASVRTYDPVLRMRDAKIVQKRVAADVPVIPLYRQGNVAVYPRDLMGVAPSPVSPLWNIGAWYFK